MNSLQTTMYAVSSFVSVFKTLQQKYYKPLNVVTTLCVDLHKSCDNIPTLEKDIAIVTIIKFMLFNNIVNKQLTDNLISMCSLTLPQCLQHETYFSQTLYNKQLFSNVMFIL